MHIYGRGKKILFDMVESYSDSLITSDRLYRSLALCG